MTEISNVANLTDEGGTKSPLGQHGAKKLTQPGSKEPLEVTVQLAAGKESTTVPAGSITGCSLRLQPFGFTGQLQLWRSFDEDEDPVLPLVSSHLPLELRLDICSCLDDPAVSPVPLVVTGLVTDKRYHEVAYPSSAGSTVLQRHYCFDFADRGSVLWSQHHPSLLLADKTIADAIKATTVQGIPVACEAAFLQKLKTVVFLHCGGENFHTTYLDWLRWLTDTHGAHLVYDYATGRFILADDKPAASVTTTLRPTDLKRATVVHPRECRHVLRVLNACANAPASDELAHERAVGGCRADVVVREPVAADYEARKTQENRRLVSRGPNLQLQLARFPLNAFRPNEHVKFTDEFSGATTWSDETYRVVNFVLDLTAAETRAEDGKHHRRAAFYVTAAADLEAEDSPWRHIPAYTPPHYPLHVEGLIMSDRGENTDKSYQIGADSYNSAEAYIVNVPLWNAQVHVPFGPTNLPGHFFFPGFKGSRVLLSLWFDGARIEHFLDHGAGVALPQDGQGNHILFGLNASEETSLRHEFVDKKPVFTIKRTHEDDTETLKLEEGNILLITQEEESLALSTETFDLTPNVALARSNLTMAKEEGVGGMTAQFESTSAELNGAISEATADATAHLQAMEQAVQAQASRAEAIMTQATKAVKEKTQQIAGASAEAKQELQERTRL